MKKLYLRSVDLEKLNIDLCFITTDNDSIRREAEVNARLIASAQDLLEALQNITALYDSDEGCRSTPEYINACKAIAKALGETK